MRARPVREGSREERTLPRWPPSMKKFGFMAKEKQSRLDGCLSTSHQSPSISCYVGRRSLTFRWLWCSEMSREPRDHHIKMILDAFLDETVKSSVVLMIEDVATDFACRMD